MKRAWNFGTVFWLGVIIALGLALILDPMGLRVAIWRPLLQLWPLLLPLWGLIKAAERLRGERPKPLFSRGEVALMVAVLLAGSGFTAASRLASDSNFLGPVGDDLDLFDILGENFQFASRVEAAVPSGSRIEVRNAYGRVEVRPGEPGRLTLEVVKSVRAASVDEASGIEPELEFTVQRRDGVYVIESNRETLDRLRRNRFRSSLSLQVPAASSLRVENMYGPVGISGLTGDQQVRNGYGAVRITDVVGDLVVDSRHSRVRIDGIQGDVRVRARETSVDIGAVDGAVRVEDASGSWP